MRPVETHCGAPPAPAPAQQHRVQEVGLVAVDLGAHPRGASRCRPDAPGGPRSRPPPAWTSWRRRSRRPPVTITRRVDGLPSTRGPTGRERSCSRIVEIAPGAPAPPRRAGPGRARGPRSGLRRGVRESSPRGQRLERRAVPSSGGERVRVLDAERVAHRRERRGRVSTVLEADDGTRSAPARARGAKYWLIVHPEGTSRATAGRARRRGVGICRPGCAQTAARGRPAGRRGSAPRPTRRWGCSRR